VPGAGVLEPFFQTLDLQGDDLVAALCEILAVGGNEGGGRDRPLQVKGDDRQGERQCSALRCQACRSERVLASPLGGQQLHIEVGAGQAVAEQGRFGQLAAVFVNQVVPGKDQVCGRFAFARIGVQVCAEQACRLALHQQSPVGGLGQDLVAGRQVADHGSSGQGCGRRGRLCDPQVLADLKSEPEIRQVTASKQQIGAERHLAAAERDRPGLLTGARGRREMAQLVEFGVIRNVLLGDDPQDLAALKNDGAVVQGRPVRQGKPDGADDIRVRGLPDQVQQSPVRGLLESLAEEQVGTGIAGQAQLGKNRQTGLPALRLTDQRKDIPAVAIDIRDPDDRGRRRHAYKTILHCLAFFLVPCPVFGLILAQNRPAFQRRNGV